MSIATHPMKPTTTQCWSDHHLERLYIKLVHEYHKPGSLLCQRPFPSCASPASLRMRKRYLTILNRTMPQTPCNSSMNQHIRQKAEYCPLGLRCLRATHHPSTRVDFELVEGPLPISSKDLRANATTSPSPSSPSPSSGSTSFSEIVLIIWITPSDFEIRSTRLLSSDSSNWSKVQIAMCWNVGSPLARNRFKYPWMPPLGSVQFSTKIA